MEGQYTVNGGKVNRGLTVSVFFTGQLNYPTSTLRWIQIVIVNLILALRRKKTHVIILHQKLMHDQV